MKWTYDRKRRRLNVMEAESYPKSIRYLLHRGHIPKHVDTIICSTSKVVVIFRGVYLQQLLSYIDAKPLPPRQRGHE
jgi:hypothetical protein